MTKVIVAEFITAEPFKAAQLFSIELAEQKGYSSKITEQGNDYLVTTDDGKSVLFKRK